MTQDRRTVSLGLGVGLIGAALAGPGLAKPQARAAKPDLAARLKALDERRQIEILRSTYGWYAARGDAAAVASLFTEDCLFEGPGAGPGARTTVRTRAALAAYLQKSIGAHPGSSIPFLYNHIIKVSGDAAEGACAIKPHVAVGDKQMVGYYVERLRKESGAWRWYDRRLYLYQPYLELPGAA
jgi:ketosteroid isomerase-like protein